MGEEREINKMWLDWGGSLGVCNTILIERMRLV